VGKVLLLVLILALGNNGGKNEPFSTKVELSISHLQNSETNMKKKHKL